MINTISHMILLVINTNTSLPMINTGSPDRLLVIQKPVIETPKSKSVQLRMYSALRLQLSE